MPNYTDYQLYQILENNGYKPNAFNLQTLKEGVDSGDFLLPFVEDASLMYLHSIPECAGLDEDSIADMVYDDVIGLLESDDAQLDECASVWSSDYVELLEEVMADGDCLGSISTENLDEDMHDRIQAHLEKKAEAKPNGASSKIVNSKFYQKHFHRVVSKTDMNNQLKSQRYGKNADVADAKAPTLNGFRARFNLNRKDSPTSIGGGMNCGAFY